MSPEFSRQTFRQIFAERELADELYQAKKHGDVQFLLDALNDPLFRVTAAQLLGELGSLEAVRPLIRLLNVSDRATRSSAAGALGKIRAAEAVPELIQRTRDENDVVPRTWAITALGAIGDERAVGPLCALLSDEDVLVRQSAARALGALGHPDAIEPLRRAARRERWFERGLHRKAIRKIARQR